MNNISFQGNFQISNNMRDKFAYRQILSEKMENILTEKFQQTTKNIPYTLELTNVNPITKYTFFTLKSENKILSSMHEKFWDDSEKMNVNNLINIYQKLILKKEYNDKFNEIENFYKNTKNLLIESNEIQALKELEIQRQEEIAQLNSLFSKRFGEKLYG